MPSFVARIERFPSGAQVVCRPSVARLADPAGLKRCAQDRGITVLLFALMHQAGFRGWNQVSVTVDDRVGVDALRLQAQQPLWAWGTQGAGLARRRRCHAQPGKAVAPSKEMIVPRCTRGAPTCHIARGQKPPKASRPYIVRWGLDLTKRRSAYQQPPPSVQAREDDPPWRRWPHSGPAFTQTRMASPSGSALPPPWASPPRNPPQG